MATFRCFQIGCPPRCPDALALREDGLSLTSINWAKSIAWPSPTSLSSLNSLPISTFSPLTNLLMKQTFETSSNVAERAMNYHQYSATVFSCLNSIHHSCRLPSTVARNCFNRSPRNSVQDRIAFCLFSHWYQRRASPSKAMIVVSICSVSEYLWMSKNRSALNNHPSRFSDEYRHLQSSVFVVRA